MRYKSLYVCDVCGREFRSKDDVLKCEASCYGLTVAQYRQWRKLSDQAERTGYKVGCSSNPTTREAFHLACLALADFEQAHHLENSPTYWADN